LFERRWALNDTEISDEFDRCSSYRCGCASCFACFSQLVPPQDGHGVLARAEKAIEAFRTRFISGGFTLGNDEAERVLRYFRRAAEGYPDDEDEWSAVIEFFRCHGGHVLGLDSARRRS
jgi:hypothetical protein